MHVNNLYCANCINPKILKLNLFTKLISFFLSILFIIINSNLVFLIIYLLVLLVLIKISGYSLKNIYKYFKDLWFINIIIFILCLFTINLYVGLYIFLSFQIVFIYDYYIYSTSSFIELRKCSIILLKPCKKLKIDHYKFGLAFVHLLYFLPEFVASSKNVIIKQKSRGIDIKHVDLKTMFIGYLNMFKKGLYLTQEKLDSQRKMRKFMLYNENKKNVLFENKIYLVDILFVLIHISLFLLIIYEEVIRYEISFIPFL